MNWKWLIAIIGIMVFAAFSIYKIVFPNQSKDGPIEQIAEKVIKETTGSDVNFSSE